MFDATSTVLCAAGSTECQCGVAVWKLQGIQHFSCVTYSGHSM